MDQNDDVVRWRCIQGCNAECCGIVPIPSHTYRIFKRKIKKKIIDLIKLKGHFILMTEDASCIFLDSNHKCAIYEHRPNLCRLYGTIEELQCPYIDINGNKRTEQDTIAFKKLIELQNKTRIDMISQPPRPKGRGLIR